MMYIWEIMKELFWEFILEILGVIVISWEEELLYELRWLLIILNYLIQMSWSFCFYSYYSPLFFVFPHWKNFGTAAVLRNIVAAPNTWTAACRGFGKATFSFWKICCPKIHAGTLLSLDGTSTLLMWERFFIFGSTLRKLLLTRVVQRPDQNFFSADENIFSELDSELSFSSFISGKFFHQSIVTIKSFIKI